MRKKAKVWLSLCSLLTAMVCVGGGVQSLKVNKSSAEDNGVAATYVSSDTTAKGYWEGVGLGKDGYLIFDSTGNTTTIGFYSDMYNIGNTQTTVAEQTLMQITGNATSGWTANGSSGWNLTKNPDDTIATTNATTKATTTNSDTHTLKSDAVVSSWGVNASKFRGYGFRDQKPFVPGSVTTTQLNMQGSGTYQDVNVGFTLNTDEKVYATFSIFDDTQAALKSSWIVALYPTAYQGGKLAGTQSIADCYGTPLATAEVTVNGTYVTFLLDGSVQKDYTVVAYRASETATSGYSIAIGGVFFDYTQGLPASATHVSSDTTTKQAWETTGYGQDGYLIFDGYQNAAGIGFYSDMYNVGDTEQTVSATTLMSIAGGPDTGYTAATSGGWDLTKNADGTIAMNSTTKVTTGNSDIHTLQSNAVIKRWGVNAAAFQGHAVRDFKPYIPTSTTSTQVRMNGSEYYNNDVNLSIVLNTDKKVLVTLHVFDYAQKVSATNPFSVGVYNRVFAAGALASRKYKTTVDNFYGTSVVTASVTQNGTYVTFLLDGSITDKYTFVAYCPTSTGASVKQTVAPAIGGIFFDEYKEAPNASMDSASLTLDGTIGVNFYMNISESYATDESAYVLLTDANGATKEVAIPAPETDGTYKFSVNAVAKDIAKTLKAQLFVGGVAVTEEYEYSVKAYCEAVISAEAGTYSDKLVALAKSLLDYGNASDNYFNGATNAFIGDVASVSASDLTAYAATKENELPDGVTVTELSLILEAETTLKIFFKATSLNGIAVTVNGEAVTPTVTGRANEYCIAIENISAKELGTTYAITIGEYVMNVSALTYAYSALQYQSASVGVVDLVKALYLYNVAAVAYFA